MWQSLSAWLDHLRHTRPRRWWVTTFVVVPWLIAIAAFFVAYSPNSLQFGSRLFADHTDGMTNYWNIWWMRESLFHLHQTPFFTHFLHWPSGTSLLGHTLTPLNTLTGAGLKAIVGMPIAYNLLVVANAGLAFFGAFVLAYHFSRRYGWSLLAGAMFQFGSFSVIHLGSHLNLSSIGWVPLFLWALVRLLEKPSYGRATGSAILLTATYYSDLYLFTYAVLTAVILGIAELWARRQRLAATWKPLAKTLLVFLLVVTILVGPHAIALMSQNARDPFAGGHGADSYSIDLAAPFVPGFWQKRFAQHYHSFSPISNYLPLTVWLLLAGGLWFRLRRRVGAPLVWFVVATTFFALSLGPHLLILGRATSIPLPYAWLAKIIPALQISGVPNRMFLIVILSASVITACTLPQVIRSLGNRRWLLVPFLVLLLVEYRPIQRLPSPPPVTVPAFVQVLAAQIGGAVFDTSPPGNVLFYQTIHHHPVYAGYIARTPGSVVQQDDRLAAAYERSDYRYLCSQQFTYLITERKLPQAALSQDGDQRLYQLDAPDGPCRKAGD